MSKSRSDRVLIASDSDEGSPSKNSSSVAAGRRQQSENATLTPTPVVTRSKSGKLKQRSDSDVRGFIGEIYQKLKGKDGPNHSSVKIGQPTTGSGERRSTRHGLTRHDSKQIICSGDGRAGVSPSRDLDSTPQENNLKVQDGGSGTSGSIKSTGRRLARKKTPKNGSFNDQSPSVFSPNVMHDGPNGHDVDKLQDGGGVTTESKKTTRRGLTRKNSEAALTPNDVSAKASSGGGSGFYPACVNSLTYKHLFQEGNETQYVEPFGTDEVLTNSSKRDEGLKETPKTSKHDDLAQLLDDFPAISSPSPPGASLQGRTKTKSGGRMISRALKALDQVKARLEKTTPPQRRSRCTDSDVELLYEENVTRVQVKVLYLSKVHRVEMKASEPFHVLTTKLAEITGEDERTLTLYLKDRCLGLTESPMSVSLTVADIIECYCMKPEADQVTSSGHINLVIRSAVTKTRTTISADPRNPLEEVLNQYKAMNNLSSSTLVFRFDGDELNPLDTPLKLDLDDGDCIDVDHF